MKFLVDAQLPARLSKFLVTAGHDATHTVELPKGNRTNDSAIIEIADSQDRIVITKDRDFRDGHLLAGSPRHLLIVGTGNITNAELLTLFETNINAISEASTDADFIELQPATLILHPRHGDNPQ